MTQVAANLEAVRARIRDACVQAGRAVESVTLVAVSKGQPAAALEEAYAAGQRHFGENYAQEFRDKADALAHLPGIIWHFLGPVQTNKVKYLVPKVALLHTLDRLELAQALQTRLEKSGTTMAALVEVNVAAEPQKHGVLPEQVPAFLEQVRACSLVKVEGLMCIPPARERAQDSIPDFAALASLAKSVGLKTLSMGMSSDYTVAVQQGASMVRVGTAIFGARQPRTGAAG